MFFRLIVRKKLRAQIRSDQNAACIKYFNTCSHRYRKIRTRKSTNLELKLDNALIWCEWLSWGTPKKVSFTCQQKRNSMVQFLRKNMTSAISIIWRHVLALLHCSVCYVTSDAAFNWFNATVNATAKSVPYYCTFMSHLIIKFDWLCRVNVEFNY